MGHHRKGRTTGNSHRADIALLALRLGAGGVLFAHGTQKLFGWFGGPGIEGMGESMESIGFKPGKPSAIASGVGEAGGGTLLALGLATPAAGAAAAGAMAGAASVHFPAGFFATSGGLEYPAFLALSATALGLAGPGRYSVDHWTGHRLNSPWLLGASFAAAAAAAACVISKRARVLAEAQAEGGSEEDSAGSSAD
jgi:putative oxidoreductase